MEYSFLETKAEGYALYASVLCYLLTIVIVLTRYLKVLRNKKLDDQTRKSKKRKVYFYAILGLLVCGIIHTALFHIFFGMFPERGLQHLNIRPSYYISIVITLAVFSFFMWFGMYLRGHTTLPKHQGPVTGV